MFLNTYRRIALAQGLIPSPPPPRGEESEKSESRSTPRASPRTGAPAPSTEGRRAPPSSRPAVPSSVSPPAQG